ncbi:MAG: hypothetical protein N3G76_03150, partial [Candidatus Micrarchaeota archaeon]|nr:hypothetical protein [Candidatus Micrarchaeota archaeon]
YTLFDVYDRKKMQFLSRSQKLEVWEDVKKGKLRVKGLFGTTPLIFPVPRIAAVKCASPDELARFIRHSAYAIDEKGNPAMMEGIVVKQDRIQFYIEFIAGKIVREEFEKGIAVNYFNLPKENNIIDPSLPVVLDYPSI